MSDMVLKCSPLYHIHYETIMGQHRQFLTHVQIVSIHHIPGHLLDTYLLARSPASRAEKSDLGSALSFGPLERQQWLQLQAFREQLL